MASVSFFPARRDTDIHQVAEGPLGPIRGKKDSDVIRGSCRALTAKPGVRVRRPGREAGLSCGSVPGRSEQRQRERKEGKANVAPRQL